MTFEVNILPGLRRQISLNIEEILIRGEVAILRAISNYSLALLEDELNRLKKKQQTSENQLLYNSYTRILSNTKNSIKQGELSCGWLRENLLF